MKRQIQRDISQMYFCTFQDSNKLLLLGKLISLSVGGLLGPDTVQPLERASLDKKRQFKSCLTIDIIEHYLTDGLEGLEGLHIGSDGHGTGPLGHSLGCHHLENKGQDMEGEMLTIQSFTLVPASCTALDISSAVASPFLGFLALMGNKIIFDLNSFNL